MRYYFSGQTPRTSTATRTSLVTHTACLRRTPCLTKRTQCELEMRLTRAGTSTVRRYFPFPSFTRKLAPVTLNLHHWVPANGVHRFLGYKYRPEQTLQNGIRVLSQTGTVPIPGSSAPDSAEKSHPSRHEYSFLCRLRRHQQRWAPGYCFPR